MAWWKIVTVVALHALSAWLGKRKPPRIDSQRDPNEIVSRGEPTSPAQVVFGERRVAGFEVYRGVETYEVSTPPFSVASPGTGRRLHLAFALCEGACEGPTGIRIGEDLIALSQGVRGTGVGLRATPDTTTDGGIRWQVAVASGGRATVYWYFAADGTQGKSLRDAADRAGSRAMAFGDQHRGHGISWCHVELDQPPLDPRNAAPKWAWPTNVPAFEFIIKGLKLPRVDTGAVEWTQNAADIRHWVETQFFGFPPSRVDAGTAKQARAICAQAIDLDKTQALGRVRFSYSLANNRIVPPTAPTGNGYPPGVTGWTITVPTLTEALPYLWVSAQVYDASTSVWGDWQAAKLLSGRPGSPGVDDADPDGRVVVRSRLAVTPGTAAKTLDPDGTDGVDTRGGPRTAPSATIEVGQPLGSTLAGTAQNVTWAFLAGSRPLISADLAEADKPVEFRSLVVTPNSAATVCALALNVSADLLQAWERGDDALQIRRLNDGSVFNFDGPDRDSNRKRDADAPYEWQARESWPDFRIWIANSGDSSFTLRFIARAEDDDDVTEIPPGIQPGEQANPYIPLFNADRNFQLYAINGVLTGRDFADPESVRRELDMAWAGRAIYDGGMLFLHPGQDSAVSHVLSATTGETLAVRTSESTDGKVNALTAELAESRVHAFRSWTMRPLRDPAAVERDGRVIQRGVGTRGFVTSPAQAEVLMAIQLRQQRAQRIVTRREEWSMDTIAIRPGQRVHLLDPDNGFSALSAGSPLAHQGDASGRYMLVVGRRLNPTDMTIYFDLVESFNDTHVPDAFRFPLLEPDVSSPGGWVPQPSGLSLKSAAEVGFDQPGLRIEATWNPSTAARTIVQWRLVVLAGKSLKIKNADGSTTTLTTTPDWGPPREQVVEGNGATITGVKDGQRYAVRIKHVSVIGIESAWSDTAEITAGAFDKSLLPTNLVVRSNNLVGIRLTWTNPTLAAPPLWRIQIQHDVFGLPGQAHFIPGTNMSWQLDPSSLSAFQTLWSANPTFRGSRFSARIQPAIRHDSNEQVGGAAEIRGVIGDASLMLTAPSVTAVAGDGQVTLQWSAVEHATRYRVQRRTQGGSWPAETVGALLTGNSYVDSTAVNDTTYEYRVRAEGNRSPSTWSNVVTATPTAGTPGVVVTPPGVATNITATSTQNTITVTWDAPSSWGTGTTRGYRAWRRIGTGAGTSSPFYAQSATRSHTFNGLTPGTAYQVTVQTSTTVGFGDAAWVDISTKAVTPEPPARSWGAWSAARGFSYNFTPGQVSPFGGVLGNVSIGADAAEEDGNMWRWNTAGGSEWQPTDLPTGQTATGVMGTKTVTIGGQNVTIQVLQSATSVANRMRRTDNNQLLVTDTSYLFSGDLNTRRHTGFNFVDAVLLSSATNLPTLPSAKRPIGFLSWARGSDGAGTQELVVLTEQGSTPVVNIYTRSYS